MKTVKKILIIIGIIIGAFVLIFILNYVRINTRYFIHKGEYVESIPVYGNKEGLVPQGLAYSKEYHVILQTSYSNNVSKLYITDFNTGKLMNELELINMDGSKNTKHVGGITTHQNTIWISNDYELDVFDFNTILNTDKKSIQPIQEIPLSFRGDFCTFYDDVLWIGDFYLYPFYDVPNGDPKLRGFSYQEEMDFDHPDYEVSLPLEVQGMSVLPNGDVAFTHSYTYLVNSFLSIHKNILKEKDGKFDRSNLITSIRIPPMAEGIFYLDDYFYILFESSSDKYSLADPKIDKILKYKIEKD